MTQEKTIKLSELIAPKFIPVHHAITDKTHDQFILKGGRGSTKSSFSAIETILTILSDPMANALVLRKVGATIRDSVYAQLEWAADQLGVINLFKFTKAPAEMTYFPTGQKILMRGTDDPLKLKSIKVSKGYLRVLWFEEVAEFNGMEEIRSVEQSVLRGGEDFTEILSYNPPDDPENWINKETKIEKAGRYVHESTYLDVPAHWLGKKFLDDAEHLRQVNELAYRHEYLGESVGIPDRIVFFGKWEIKDFETPHISKIFNYRFYYGADWGFAKDPTAMVRCFILTDGPFRDLYIDHEVGGVGVDIDETPALFDQMPESRKWPIYADCARPETISYVKRKGFNISAAKKWTGSIEDGIEFIRGFRRIYIHPRCKKTIHEFKVYQYKVDKTTKEVLPVILDQDNHCLIAGTMIDTDKGEKPIEEITTKDKVLTRNGYKRVLWSGVSDQNRKVKRVLTQKGYSIIGTGDHKVLTHKGFCDIDSLSYGDKLLIKDKECQNYWLHTEKNGEDIQNLKEEAIENILNAEIDTCTTTCGNFITEQEKREIISTTKTETVKTTIFQILKKSHPKSIWEKSINFLKNALTNKKRYSTKLDCMQINGIKAKQVKNGIGNMPLTAILEDQTCQKKNAIIAEKYSNQQHIIRNSVQTNAKVHGDEKTDLMMLLNVANYAEINSKQINIEDLGFVVDHVLRVEDGGIADKVYDITVEDTHEFFANGILVHNCIDALRYALYHMIINKGKSILDMI